MAQVPQLSSKKEVDLYKSTLNFKVIARYDPKIKQLLFISSHCVIYKFLEDEWVKTDFQGTLALYLRYFITQTAQKPLTAADLQDLFCYGLILLNRGSPENFSIGLLPNSTTATLFPNGVENNGVKKMDVEINDNLIILKNLLGEIYGLWVFDEKERTKLHQLVQICLGETP